MKRNVLYISTSNNKGGSEYEKEAYELLNKNFNIKLILLNPKIPSYLIKKHFRFTHQIKEIEGDFDILISNIMGLKSGILKKSFQKKILIVHHIDFDSKGFWTKKFNEIKILQKLKQFDYIITVSEYWANYVKKYAPNSEVRIIHNSFDIKKFEDIKKKINKSELLKRYGIPKDKIVVYGGNPQKEKGVLVLKAKLNPDKYFIVTTGSGNEENNFFNLKLPYDDYLSLLAICDIAVLLSNFKEGWNRCAHEALLMGTPIIGNPVAGFNDFLSKTNQYKYSKDSNLDELITIALNDRGNLKKGIDIAKEYTFGKFSDSWNKLLTEIIN